MEKRYLCFDSKDRVIVDLTMIHFYAYFHFWHQYQKYLIDSAFLPQLRKIYTARSKIKVIFEMSYPSLINYYHTMVRDGFSMFEIDKIYRARSLEVTSIWINECREFSADYFNFMPRPFYPPWETKILRPIFKYNRAERFTIKRKIRAVALRLFRRIARW